MGVIKVITDLHLHSKYSRATSKDMDLMNIWKYGRKKGLDVVGTGDFSHPLWLAELRKNLEEIREGIYAINKSKIEQIGHIEQKGHIEHEHTIAPYFLLSNEISLMYSDDKKQRRVHLLLFAKNFEIIEQINEYLSKKGGLDYDGRPIFSITCDEFTEAILEISKEVEIIPSHCMTPWFGIFGSVTGFDSLKEAFKDQVKNIHAVETGLSADQAMLCRMSFLDEKALVSFSDSHSYWPWRLGREATAFEILKFDYKNIIDAIRNKKISFTIETSPCYGKYHYDGHRQCGFSSSPIETKKLNGKCPVCNRPLTVGVLNRVEQLADRDEEYANKISKKISYKTVLPLHEIISGVLKIAINTKRVWQEYNKLTSHPEFPTEFSVLFDMPAEKIVKMTSKKITEMILKNREGKIKIKPGYDGVYGKAIFEEQNTLSTFA